jgi:hypothetical protein
MSPLMSTIDTHCGHPPFALLAKAANFLERSITVGNGPAGGHSPAQFNDSPRCSELQNPLEVFILALQVDNFRKSLPSLARNDGFSANHTLLVTHCLTNVATIRLTAPHLDYPGSVGRAFLAAEQVVSDILLVDTSAWDQANPILGVRLILSGISHQFNKFPFSRCSTLCAISISLTVICALPRRSRRTYKYF